MKFKKLYEANKWWNDWKFQLHWHKLEWLNSKSTPKRIKLFSDYSKKIYFDKSDKTDHFLAILN